jgi:tetratricopeptide (TPR) repeat protein
MVESNSVFISYRRTASFIFTLAVYQEFQKHGIDCFFDLEDIPAGKFDSVILNQIAARPYFMPILMPGTLDRCTQAGDWVLREYTEAVRLQRVIIPLRTTDFDFGDIEKYLPPDIAAEFNRANIVEVPTQYFRYAIQDITSRILKPIPIPVQETPENDRDALARKLALANGATLVPQEELEREIRHFRIRTDDLDAQIAHYEQMLPLVENGDSEMGFIGSKKAFIIQGKKTLASSYIHRGNRKMQQGDIAGAVEDYTAGIKYDPDNPTFADAYLNRGVAREQKRDLKGAIEDYTKAIALQPTLALAYGNRGQIYIDLENFKAAITDFNEAVRLDPELASAFNSRGVAREKMGDLDGAITDYSKAIEVNPSHFRAYFNRAEVFGQKGNWKAAITNYDAAIRLNPRSAAAYFYRSSARYELGDINGAITDLDEAVRIEPNWGGYGTRGKLKMELGDLRGALADMNEAVRLAPYNGEVYVHRSMVYYELGDYAKADADLQKLLEVEPNHPVALEIKKNLGK